MYIYIYVVTARVIILDVVSPVCYSIAEKMETPLGICMNGKFPVGNFMKLMRVPPDFI